MLESKFATIEGYRVHYWQGGSGFPVLMLHGVGPGTSIVGNFGPVLEPLAEKFHVLAVDLIGFGESERKREAPFFDLDLWVRQGLAMLDLLPSGPCGIAGHSLGGALALKLAARSRRIVRVLTSSSIGAPYPINAALEDFWSLPVDRAALRRSMAAMVFQDAAITDEMIEGRWKLLQAPGYADYFGAMFAPPRQRYIDSAILSSEELGRITGEVVMLHGREDRPCPIAATTVKIAEKLRRADLHLLGRCGHNLPRERTEDYLAAATGLFARQGVSPG